MSKFGIFHFFFSMIEVLGFFNKFANEKNSDDFLEGRNVAF